LFPEKYWQRNMYIYFDHRMLRVSEGSLNGIRFYDVVIRFYDVLGLVC
jgi:hypothetical protein